MNIDIGPHPDLQPDLPFAALREIPTSIIGDELGRRAILDPEIRPIGRAGSFAGPALTVECPAGDISAIVYALDVLQPGQVVIVDARHHVGTAVWGEIMQSSAKTRGAVAAIVDGSMRDSAFLAKSAMPAYARGISSRGPQAGLSGSVNRPISCGGVAVRPGDMIVGDEDGIVVVQQDQCEGLVDRCRARIAFEAQVIEAVLKGKSARELLSFPAPGSTD